METLDLADPQDHAVRFGAATVTEMVGHTSRGHTYLRLASSSGQRLARVPTRLVQGADIGPGMPVVACGRMTEEHGEPVLALELLARLPQPTTALLSLPLAAANGPAALALEMPPHLAAYLLWLVAGDLARWGERRSRLRREEVTAFAMFLHDAMEPEYRTPVPALDGGPERRLA